jgi:hypothetical protein
MQNFEQFLSKEEMEAKHEGKRMPGSNETNMSTVVHGIGLRVERPGVDETYRLFLNSEEVMKIGGSRADAETVFTGAAEILRNTADFDEAMRQIGDLVTSVDGGSQEIK